MPRINNQNDALCFTCSATFALACQIAVWLTNANATLLPPYWRFEPHPDTLIARMIEAAAQRGIVGRRQENSHWAQVGEANWFLILGRCA
jgi:hypothetical protein